MIRRAAAVALALLACIPLLTCCARPLAISQPVDSAGMVRNQGYALLYSTVKNVAHIDMLLIIRNPNPKVDDLVRAIAEFAGEAANRLEALAQEDPTIGLDQHGLPEMEVKSRNAISDRTANELVFIGGKEFEFNILLTQHLALNYITHLARELREQDTSETRKRALEHIANECDALHKQVLARLMGPYVGAPE